METPNVQIPAGDADLVTDVKQRVGRLIDLMVQGQDEDVDFEGLLYRAGELWRRKQSREGTKSETRDLLGEVIFSRIHRAFRTFREGPEARDALKAAEWLMGMLYSGSALNDLARAFDRKMLETQRNQDFSFAGQTDFISIQEVLQLLSGGGYSGMLALEKDDNRLDLFIRDGLVNMFDPHHLTRRILPTANAGQYREIPVNLIEQAEQLKSSVGSPILVGLHLLEFLRAEEVSELLQNLGLEVFYEFLTETDSCTFFYKKLDEMPEFVDQFGYPMQVTPILLEGSKRMDEWRVLLDVFPDPDADLQPVPDMFARIDGLNLGVHEIKMLSVVNHGASPRKVAAAVGLPLYDVYQHLLRYARDGIIVPVGGLDRLNDMTFTLEETMERAFDILDENDDELSKEKALDVFSDPFDSKTGDDGLGDSFLDILASKDQRSPRR